MNEALPLAFLTRMRAQLGADADACLKALEEPYQRGLRLNPRKPLAAEACSALEGIGAPVPWYERDGRYLSMESTVGADPLHEAGAYYIQEPSAMAPVSVLAPQPGERVLDLCAAPGGKSTQIADMLAGKGLLVCNEPVFSRAKVLSRNLERMGVPNALAVSAEPERLAPLWREAFDAVLVDAPCSGEGMFRRHPETRLEWSEQSPQGCAERQARILDCAARMLKSGGRLVYSTCTFNLEENDRTILALLERHPELTAMAFTLPAGEDRTLNAPRGMLHLYPHQVRGEGHFVALLKKHEAAETDGALFSAAAERLSPTAGPLPAAYDAFASALGGSLPHANAQLGDALICAPDLPPLSGIKVLRAGIQLGTLKGKVFAPDHALAMALTPPYGIPTFPLTRGEALAYQRGETLPAPDSLSGYVLATYQGLALGFGKCSGGRMKNHYPKGLRRP